MYSSKMCRFSPAQNVLVISPASSFEIACSFSGAIPIFGVKELISPAVYPSGSTMIFSTAFSMVISPYRCWYVKYVYPNRLVWPKTAKNSDPLDKPRRVAIGERVAMPSSGFRTFSSQYLPRRNVRYPSSEYSRVASP